MLPKNEGRHVVDHFKSKRLQERTNGGEFFHLILPLQTLELKRTALAIRMSQ